MWKDENVWGWILGELHKNMIVLNATGLYNENGQNVNFMLYIFYYNV